MMAKKVQLSRRRKKWVAQRKPDAIKGGKLAAPAAISSRYSRELKRLVEIMRRESLKAAEQIEAYAAQETLGTMDGPTLSVFARQIMAKLAKRFDTLFGKKADKLAKSFIDQVERESTAGLKSSVKTLAGAATLSNDLFSGDIGDITRASVDENVALIKTIPEQFMKRLSGDVYRAIAGGSGLSDITESVRKYSGMSERRVRLIADDQTRKAYNNINRARIQKVGITKGEWIHSGGAREPRESHVKMDGKIFDLEKGLWDSTAQMWVHPGELPYCRCSFRPVIELDEDDLDAA